MIGKDNKHKRSLRRHHYERLFDKMVSQDYYHYSAYYSYEERKKALRGMQNTRHRCSGYCCGNPRKWFGEKSIQEKRQSIGPS